MVTIPNHFEEAFPWISNPPSKLKVMAPGTKWLEKEIIYIILKAPDDKFNDFRLPLIKSLATMKEDMQVSYIKAAAKCLAEAAISTKLPKEKQVWYEEVHNLTKKLILHLKSEPKKNFPQNWSNLFTLFLSVIENSNTTSSSKLSEMLKSVENMKLGLVMKTDVHKTHGIFDLVAILNIVSQESMALVKGKNAIAFYKHPQNFFNEISINKALYLDYQRRAVQALAKINQKSFSKPFDALTASVLSCVFNQLITNKKVMGIRNKLESKLK